MPSVPAAFPPPRVLSRQEGFYRFRLQTRVVLEDAATEGERMAAEWLANVLENEHRVRCGLESSARLQALQDAIVLLDASRPGGWSRWLPDLELPADLRHESFWLRVTPEKVVAAGAGPWAVLYAAQALSGFLRVQHDRPALPCVVARDEPAFNLRGVHLSLSMPGTDLGFAWRILGEMARLRMNTLVLLMNRGMRYESCPGLAADHALSKTEVGGLLDIARGYGIQVVPHIDLLTRQQDFLLAFRPDLVENPEAPLSYCPARSDVYRVLDPVCRELLDLFRPQWFHVGHADLGRDKAARLVAVCPTCRSLGRSEVIARDLGHWTELAEASGGGILVWLGAFGAESTVGPGTTDRSNAPCAMPCTEPAQDRAESEASLDKLSEAWGERLTVFSGRDSVLSHARGAWRRRSASRRFVLWTGKAVNEPEFSRHGLLHALDTAGKLFWNPEFEPPPAPMNLGPLIRRP